LVVDGSRLDAGRCPVPAARWPLGQIAQSRRVRRAASPAADGRAAQRRCCQRTRDGEKKTMRRPIVRAREKIKGFRLLNNKLMTK
jgi:hypothetical protein